MSRIPLIHITIPFIIGIVAHTVAGWTGWFVIPCGVAAAVLYCIGRKIMGLALVSLAAGCLVAMIHQPHPFTIGMEGMRSFSGVVTDEVEAGAMKVSVVRLDSCDGRPIRATLAKIIVPAIDIPLEECDRVRFTADLSPLSHSTDLPDETDYNRMDALRGVVAEGFVTPDSITCRGHEPGILNDIRRFRKDVSSLLAEGGLSSGTTDFLIATLAGEREILTPTHRELFSQSGLAHLLALSGLHVGIIAGAFSLLFFPLTLWRRWPACLLSILALWAFAIMTGLAPSVTRSVIMSTIFLISVMMQREWSPVNALCFAVLAILVFAPHSIFYIGFQMSFIAVLSIVLFAGRLNPFPTTRRNARWAMMLITVPIAAMLGTGIVGAFHFHTFPVFFLISNVPAGVILPPLLAGGMLKVALGAMGIPHGALDDILNFIYGILHRTASDITGMSWSGLHDIYISPVVMTGYFSALAVFTIWLYRRRAAYLIASVMLVMFTICAGMNGRGTEFPGELYVTRSTSETTLLVCDNRRMFSFTTAHPSQIEAVIERDKRRYSRYMLRRGVKNIEILSDGFCSPEISRKGNIVCHRGKRIALVSDGPVMRTDPIHYAVVCRGFRGDVVKLAKSLGADSILLSSDLDLRRHDRYAESLTKLGIPFRSLRDAPLVLK